MVVNTKARKKDITLPTIHALTINILTERFDGTANG
jgi:hypothetical protein